MGVSAADGCMGSRPSGREKSVTNSRTVLVVDDCAETRRALKELLEGQGYTVLAASNGRQALEAARAIPVVAVLVEALLPDMDGYELCRRIKTHDGSAAKVVVYTDDVDAVDAVKARAVRADDLVGRTGDMAHLQASVRRLLAGPAPAES